MGYASLRACVEDLRRSGRLRVIDYPLDPRLEIAAVQRRALAAEAPALLFSRPRGAAFPMLANLFGTRERVNYIFRDALENVKFLLAAKADPAICARSPLKTLKTLAGALRARPREEGSWETRGAAPVLEKVRAKSELPGLVSWPEDGGAFITLPLVYTENSRGQANLGMYRVQLTGGEYGDDEAGVHYQLHRGIGAHHAEALARGESLPVQICVGGPPALTVAAIMPLPEGVSELLFAGMLGGRGIRLARKPGFPLPFLADCDFAIVGRLAAGTKPEGPFGDHLGYYSLKHEFPYIKIAKIFSREDAIWPFTTVGRPPQEDTVFGDLIRELVAPLVGNVFNGVKETRAVDAAGVHPLLLAVGRESYAPYERERKPRELLTQAAHLLGDTQTSLAKYLIIAADEDGVNVDDIPNFFRRVLEKTDFARDLRFLTGFNVDTLDYAGTALNEGSKLIWAVGGPKLRELSAELAGAPALPPGYKNPRVVAPGILAVEAPPHKSPRGVPDEAIENDFSSWLERWPEREGFPLLVLVDDADFAARSWDNFLWVAFTRSDPATDIYGARARILAKRWICEAPLVIDARRKNFHAPVLCEDAETTKKIERLAAKNGPLYGLF